MRYERKFRVENLSFEELQQLVLSHQASFRKAFADRTINSIYLDTFDFTYMEENIAGLSRRLKQRIRWYGENVHEVHQPILEIKLKENAMGMKRRVPLPDFTLDGSFDYQQFMQQHLWLASTNVEPTVIVRYIRSYFLSFNKKYRLTIDRNLTYYAIDKRLKLVDSPVKDQALIIELKYDQKNDSDIEQLTQSFPFRMTRNSKYIHAILNCY